MGCLIYCPGEALLHCSACFIRQFRIPTPQVCSPGNSGHLPDCLTETDGWAGLVVPSANAAGEDLPASLNAWIGWSFPRSRSRPASVKLSSMHCLNSDWFCTLITNEESPNSGFNPPGVACPAWCTWRVREAANVTGWSVAFHTHMAGRLRFFTSRLYPISPPHSSHVGWKFFPRSVGRTPSPVSGARSPGWWNIEVNRDIWEPYEKQITSI